MNKRCTDPKCRKVFSTLEFGGKCPHCGKEYPQLGPAILCPKDAFLKVTGYGPEPKKFYAMKCLRQCLSDCSLEELKAVIDSNSGVKLPFKAAIKLVSQLKEFGVNAVLSASQKATAVLTTERYQPSAAKPKPENKRKPEQPEKKKPADPAQNGKKKPSGQKAQPRSEVKPTQRDRRAFREQRRILKQAPVEVKPGMVLEGVVRRVGGIGAVVQISKLQHGLLHISRYPRSCRYLRIATMEPAMEAVQPHDMIAVRVLPVHYGGTCFEYVRQINRISPVMYNSMREKENSRRI